MGNIFKNFALNKVTVTILGIVASAAVLIIGYSYRTNTSGSTLTVYYVTQDVDSNTQLTENMIKKTRVNNSLQKTSPDLITNLDQIKDKNGEFFFVNYGHSLTKGKLLYRSDLIAKADKSDEKLYENLKENETIFKIDVDMESTHGDTFQKGYAMNIYVEGKDETNNVILNKFIENLRIIDVVDNKWASTKEEENSAPKYILVAVNYEMFELLTKITEVPDYGFKIVPDDTRKPYDTSSEPKIVNESIKNIIEANTAYTN